MTKQEMDMTLAVAEAIVQRREVSWVRYSNGRPVRREDKK